MKITREQVMYVAYLARLNLPEEEIETYQRQLDQILHYIDRLNEVDTSTVEPTTHIIPITNVLREDRVTESLPADKALANAPQTEAGAFCVPKVIE